MLVNVRVDGVMGRTRDFEACDPSSIPGTTLEKYFFPLSVNHLV